MNPSDFVHLRAHTEYSIHDGIARIQPLFKAAQQDQQWALGISDLNNFFGLIKFYKQAQSHKIKPIIGVDLDVSGLHTDPVRLLLIAQNQNGYQRICEWISQSWLHHKDRLGQPSIPFAQLCERNEDVLLLSGTISGSIQGALVQPILMGQQDRAKEITQQLQQHFPDRCYIEIARAGFDQEELYIHHAIDLANEFGLPVVATHPIQFMNKEDYFAHELRVCIAQGNTVHDPRRVSRFKDTQHFLTQAQMREKFADLPESLINAGEIAKRCNLRLSLGKSFLPAFVPPEPISIEVYLRQTVELALEKHLQRSFPDETIRAQQSPHYQTRLNSELSVIIKMDFSGYFLIVSDFIGWAKQNGVPVGPGRGSGAGSLVAFLLGITNLDPLKYDLLFERFLNPERVSMPDFDIDFCQEKRELVIEYVRKKYGKDSVSQIVTFGSMGAKAVLRDVGRVLDMPLGLCDSLAKLVPNNPADPWTLDRAYKEDPQFKEKVDNDDDVNTLFQHAKQLEGITRNVGMHAGGVLIAPGKLTEFCPLYSADEEQGGVVSQFDKDDVEAVGLVKFDFLGLRNLTIIQSALDNMAQLDPTLNDFDLDSIVLDDPLVYQVFENANTTSVFQSESQSAKDLEAKLKPDNFEELIALMALNRPGPLGSGMVDDYIARKNQVRQTHRFDESWYFHPSLTQVLKPTYGVIVYQEQVMLVAQILAGYTLGGADLLRRAMGKKKPEEMAQQRTIFVSGATNNGVEPKMAEYLFDLMEKFAEYGFNKSHSAAYALIAYQTAWLKHYHTAAYMAAVLSSEMQNTDDIEIIYKDTLINHIDILPPDINTSFWPFRPVNREQIRYGLGAIKGVGQAAVEAIVEERKQGLYTSLFDLCRRVDRKHINRRVLESLIRAGAFDSINPHRAALFASVERALHYGEQSANTKNQVGLFALEDDNTIDEPDLIELSTWGIIQQLSEEKLALGFNVSGRLFDAYADQVRPFIKTKLNTITIDNDYWLTGVVVSVRAKMSKRGKLFFVSIEDEADSKEFLIGQQQFEAWKELFKEDQLVIVKVRVRLDKFTGSDKLYVDEVYNLDQARALFLQFIKLRVPEQSLDALVTTLKNHQNTTKNLSSAIAPKPSPLKIEYVITEQSIATELSGANITLTSELLDQIANINNVSIELQYS